jgi:hypothetical protein
MGEMEKDVSLEIEPVCRTQGKWSHHLNSLLESRKKSQKPIGWKRQRHACSSAAERPQLSSGPRGLNVEIGETTVRVGRLLAG